MQTLKLHSNLLVTSLFHPCLLSFNCCFRTAFKKTREVYSKLGQHIYPHQLDSKRPLQINRGTFPSGDKYIYFGQLEEGTSKWDGVGIWVDSNGAIYEGCSKNNWLNGFGRYIYKSGNYYIGEFKD